MFKSGLQVFSDFQPVLAALFLDVVDGLCDDLLQLLIIIRLWVVFSFGGMRWSAVVSTSLVVVVVVVVWVTFEISSWVFWLGWPW